MVAGKRLASTNLNVVDGDGCGERGASINNKPSCDGR